jgi:phage-related baseplate assembly protein
LEYSNLQESDFLVDVSYEDLLSENISNLKERLSDWTPLASDRYMPLVELFTYKEYLQKKRINNAVKSMLAQYAKGKDLDNVASRYGVKRSRGIKPRANYLFMATGEHKNKIYIPKGFTLSSSNGVTASLLEPIAISVGEKESIGVMELNLYTKESMIIPTQIITPIEGLQKANIVEGTYFKSGAEKEDDERLREKIFLSFGRYSTAGTEDAYKFHIYQADDNIQDVKIYPEPRPESNISVIYRTKTDSDLETVHKRITEYLEKTKVKPVGDRLFITPSEQKVISFSVTAFSKNPEQYNIQKIKEIINGSSFKIGESLFVSKVYTMLSSFGFNYFNVSGLDSNVEASDYEHIVLDVNIEIKRNG